MDSRTSAHDPINDKDLSSFGSAKVDELIEESRPENKGVNKAGRPKYKREELLRLIPAIHEQDVPFVKTKECLMTHVTNFPFLRLPSEIRMMIYELALSSNYWLRIAHDGPKRRNLRLWSKDSGQTIVPALILVNRQIFREAGHLLYTLNTIQFEKWQEIEFWLYKISSRNIQHVTKIAVHYGGNPLELRKAMKVFKTLGKSENLQMIRLGLGKAGSAQLDLDVILHFASEMMAHDAATVQKLIRFDDWIYAYSSAKDRLDWDGKCGDVGSEKETMSLREYVDFERELVCHEETFPITTATRPCINWMNQYFLHGGLSFPEKSEWRFGRAPKSKRDLSIQEGQFSRTRRMIEQEVIC